MKRELLLSYLSTRKIILVVTVAYTAVVLTVLLHRFWQYEIFYYDHGIFEAASYHISQGKIPTFFGQQGMAHVYIDHVYPSLQAVLAPSYWINDSYETPVVVLALLTGFSILIGYEVGKKLKVHTYLLYALLFAYMFFIGLQNALIFYVHDITMQMPFLMLLFLALLHKRMGFYYALLLFNLGFKETVTVTVIALGIGLLLFYDRSFRKHALITILIGILYGLFTTQVIVPAAKLYSFGFWGKYGFPPQFPDYIWDYILKLINTAQKRETLFTSLITFGFLPLFSPFAMVLFLQDFAQRFILADHPFRSGLNLHYNASLAVLLFIGSLFSASRLQSHGWYRRFIFLHAAFIVGMTAYLHQLVYHGPLGLIYNRDFFNITQNQGFMNDFIAKVPKEGSIMTQSNLAVRFTHRDLSILTSHDHVKDIRPDIIAMDFRDGQNANNYWPMDQDKMASVAAYLRTHPDYTAIFSEPHRYIFVKKKAI